MSVLSFLTEYLDVTTAIVGLIVLLAVWWLMQPRDLPPGPLNLPLVWIYKLMGATPESYHEELYKKYGPVTRYCTGSMETIAFLNYESTKQSFISQGDNFAGKSQEIGFKTAESDTGIGFMEGEPWKEHRRFILSTFRDFGMGKHSLEPRVTEEIQMFTDELSKQKGQPVDWAKLLSVSVANVICALEFGCRYEYGDPEFVLLRDILASLNRLVSGITFMLVFPWMRFIPFFNYFSGWNWVKKINGEFKGFFAKKIVEHRKVYQPESRRDLIDAFDTEKKKVVEKTGNGDNFSDEVLIGTLRFLFIAGSETIVSTMRWCLAILLTFPDVRKKIQKEIDDVIGDERTPSISDRQKMIYTEAFLNEVHRYASIVPFIINKNLEETTVMGYRIPKRSNVLASLHRIHHDPTIWEKPEDFRPERFIDGNGKLTKTEHLLAFGAGKRTCIGESLARMELFLYLTSILQRFELQVPEGETISLAASMELTRSPKPYKLCFTPRKE